MGGSALTNEYFNASWHELQILLNSGNHRHRAPVDWIYLIGRLLDLYRVSQRPEPARLLVAVIEGDVVDRSAQLGREIGPKGGAAKRPSIHPS
jgi:hypothetical protein